MVYSISVVFQDFIDLLKAHYVESIKFGLLAYFLPYVILSIFFYSAFPHLASFGFESTQELDVSYIIFQVAIMFFSLVYSASIFVIATNNSSDNIFSDSLWLAFKMFLVGLSFLLLVAVGILLIVGVSLAGIIWLAILLGFVLFFCVIISYILISLYPVELAKGASLTSSITNSVSLIKNSFWRVVATYLLALLAAFAALIIIGFPSLIVSGALMLLGLAVPVMAAIISAILSAAVTVLVTPFAAHLLVSVHKQVSQ